MLSGGGVVGLKPVIAGGPGFFEREVVVVFFQGRAQDWVRHEELDRTTFVEDQCFRAGVEMAVAVGIDRSESPPPAAEDFIPLTPLPLAPPKDSGCGSAGFWDRQDIRASIWTRD